MSSFQLSTGKPLVIREAKKEDAPVIIDYINKVCKETDNLTFGEGEFGITVDNEVEFIEGILKSDNQLMICAFIEENLVGQLTFNAGHRPRVSHAGEFGITVLKEYWGLGIGTELIKYMIHWAKETGIIRKINLRVRSDNQGAIRLYQSLNFVYEGTITREFLIDGKFYDSLHMGMEID